jgi:hypothetical protein
MLNKTRESKTREILRWLAMVPGAIMASLGVAFLSYYLMWLASSENEARFWLVLRDVVPNGLSGGIFVHVGGMIAPRHGRVTMIILSLVAIVIFGVDVFLESGRRSLGSGAFILGAGVIGACAVKRTE